jgi:hypothetical protein
MVFEGRDNEIFRIVNYNNEPGKKRPSSNSETVRDENFAGDSVNPLPYLQGNGLRNVGLQTT